MNGIRFELIERYDKAVEFLNEATIEFKNEKNFPMMYVTLGHLINIHEDDDDYVHKLTVIHQGVAENLESSADFLLDFLEKKIEMAKELVQLLVKVDSENSANLDLHKNQKFAKLAVKLNLSQTLNKLQAGRGPKNPQIMEIMNSLEETRRELEEPGSDLVMKGVGNHSFVSTSVHRLKNAVLNIHMGLLLSFYGKPFQLIKKEASSNEKPKPKDNPRFGREIKPKQIDSVQSNQKNPGQFQ